MGSTESKGETNRLELEYRLVRRFISDFYDGTEITIVEHKQTKEQVALREIITQFNPQSIVNQLQNRKLTQHRNLIQTRNYWMENDFNICSNLFKLYAIF
jgi:transcription initiation factor IIE alpha subunit